jgi:hypothetical protein
MDAYNGQGLSPVQFLFAVMRDQSLPIRQRVSAASKLMRICPDGPPKPTILVKIYGMGELELQEYIDSLSLSPEEQSEVRAVVDGLVRCNELGIGPVDHMPVKGHS